GRGSRRTAGLGSRPVVPDLGGYQGRPAAPVHTRRRRPGRARTVGGRAAHGDRRGGPPLGGRGRAGSGRWLPPGRPGRRRPVPPLAPARPAPRPPPQPPPR